MRQSLLLCLGLAVVVGLANAARERPERDGLVEVEPGVWLPKSEAEAFMDPDTALSIPPYTFELNQQNVERTIQKLSAKLEMEELNLEAPSMPISNYPTYLPSSEHFREFVYMMLNPDNQVLSNAEIARIDNEIHKFMTKEGLYKREKPLVIGYIARGHPIKFLKKLAKEMLELRQKSGSSYEL